MPKSARGQITIVDLNDGKTISAYLRPNKALSQIYNTDDKSYAPAWSSSSPMRLYPELYVSGNAANQVGTSAVTRIEWTINGYALGDTHISSFQATAPFNSSSADGTYLQFATNMQEGQYRVECKITYHDASTGQDVVAKTTQTIQKNDTTGSSIKMVMYTPNGISFHRDEKDSSKSTTELTIVAEMWRGSAEDVTDVTYAWYKDGVKITSTNAGTITGYTTKTLTVKANDIDNVSLFKCEIKDTDNKSSTYNQVLTDAVSLYDMTDPFEVEIQSTTGDTLTNNATTTVLNAVIKQNGEVIPTTNGIYTNAKFVWKMYDSGGSLVKYYNNNQSIGSKWVAIGDGVPTNNPSIYSNVTVSKSDITYRCTIICEVTNI